MVPTTLAGWTRETLTALLEARAHESDSFEFKEQLPHPKDMSGKERLTAACAAFANSNGGFLVFGVADDRRIPAQDRLVGMLAHDFPEHFGNFPSQVEPRVDWEFKPGGIPLENGKVIQVVFVPKSWRAPHAVDISTATFRFPKRTNKGVENMSIGEIQSTFLNIVERRRRLDLLRSELDFAGSQAKAVVDADRRHKSQVSFVKFDLTLFNTVVGDTYSLLQDSSALIGSLQEVRRRVLKFNGIADEYVTRLVAANDINSRLAVGPNLNSELFSEAEMLVSSIARAKSLLDQFIAKD